MNRRSPVAAWWVGALLACLAGPVFAVSILDVQIQAVGAGPVDAESVMAHISARPGQEFNPNAVSRDVRSLKETGRYSFVSAEVETSSEGVILIYRVEPQLRIRRLTIEGAQFYSNKKIRDLMELGVGDLVDEATLAVHIDKVTDAYHKKYFPDARADYTIDEAPESGTADITVRIEEGRRVKVRDIDFTGNEAIPARDLRKAMGQKTTGLFSWISGRGTLDGDSLEADRLVLKRQFQDEGYLDARIGDPAMVRTGSKGVNISIPVEQGILYTVGTVTLDGTTLFPEEDVMRAVRILPGDIASLLRIEESRQNIRDYYGSRGYINTRASTRFDPHPDTGIVDIAYGVEEGKLARIRNIDIKGNTRTKDKVIRRELLVYPGDIFNEVRVRQSERILQNLGFFSYVASTPVPTDDPDAFDLVYEVEEQRSGQFVVGAGFSSVDDLIGFVELSQGNFDIGGWPFTGGGQKFKIRLQLGTQRRDWQVSFVEPWFLDRRLQLGFDLFQHERRFLSDDYDQRNTGGSVHLTKSLRGPYRLRMEYSLEDVEVTDVDENASDIIKAEEGSRIKSAGSLVLIRDTRNNPFIPTRGSRTTAGATLAGGIFAGETDIYELRLRSAQYYPLWKEHVFSLRGTLAVVEEYGDTDYPPIFDRLFLGGSNNLRGFEFRDVGPKDENGEPIGGRSQAYVSFEYTIPVVEKVRAAAFYDIGMVYLDPYEIDPGNYNSDAGVGIRFDIPGFPLQFDYAWPLKADEFNDRSSGRFNFLIGYQR